MQLEGVRGERREKKEREVRGRKIERRRGALNVNQIRIMNYTEDLILFNIVCAVCMNQIEVE